MIMAMAPGVASAQTQPDAIDTSVICGDVESNFTDIAGSAHEYNVRCMADFGLTEGLAPDGVRYGPRLDVTRGQMASFIARFIEDYDGPLPPGNPARFNDVPPTDSQYTHASNIHKLAAINVVEGTNASDGRSYAPNAHVTRGQMASFIRRALSYLDNGQVNPLSAPPAGPDAFPDDDGSVHEPNINALAGVRIVEGFQDGDYRPLALVKRDQMASFVMRAYAWAESEGLGEDGPPPPPPGDFEVTVTASPTTVNAGDTFTLTFAGDTDEVDSVDVSGACIDDIDDGSLAANNTLVVTTTATAADGNCVIDVDVTYSDDSEQELTVNITIVAAEVPVDPALLSATVDTDLVGPGTMDATDGWTLMFNEAVDTFVESADTGATFEVETDSGTITIQCIHDGGVGDGNFAATCDLEDDGTTLVITLLVTPTDEDGAIGVPYNENTIIVDTTVLTADGDPVDAGDTPLLLPEGDDD